MSKALSNPGDCRIILPSMVSAMTGFGFVPWPD